MAKDDTYKVSSESPIASSESPIAETAPLKPLARLKRIPHRWHMGRLLVYTLVVAFLIHLFVFETFTIPSASMENTLKMGDRVLVTKWQYGARTPVTLGIPFTNLYFGRWELPFTRFWGTTSVQRGDVAVFNYPPEKNAIDRKVHYVKRLVAIAGDTLKIAQKNVYVNGKQVPLNLNQQQNWVVQFVEDLNVLPQARLEAVQAKEVQRLSNQEVLIQARLKAVETLKQLPYIRSITPFVRQGFMDGLFPKGVQQNIDTFQSIWIPKEGATMPLNPETWKLYGTVINQFEHEPIQSLENAQFRLNGNPITHYTFKQNYYFGLGDNRDQSTDSRFWGFIPEDHLVGKALLIYYSADPETAAPRIDRILKPIE